MAYLVEDGTGIVGATSYATEAFFVAYFTDRGNTTAAALASGTIQALLIAATDYIDFTFGRRFRGQRRWDALLSRSVLTVTANPSDGETVVFGSNTYTFRTTPSATNDVEIGDNAIASLANLALKIGEVDTDDFAGSEFSDPDVSAITLFGTDDGVTTTEGLANGSFDGAVTAGKSAKRQPLEFPRIKLYDPKGNLVAGIPVELQQAACEYAWRANSAELAPDPVIDSSGAQLTVDKTKIGPIEIEKGYADNASIRITRPYPAADKLLNEFLLTGGVIRN